MHPIETYLNRYGRSLIRKQSAELLAQAGLAIMVYLLLHFLSVLIFRSMSMTWTGLLAAPCLILAALLCAIPWRWLQLNNQRKVAKYLERRFPELQLSVRSSLDFIEGKADGSDDRFQAIYLDRVRKRVASLDTREYPKHAWTRYALTALIANLVFWAVFNQSLLGKFYNPSISFGQTHLNLAEGSITIFEPEYTQIPGRTLPLKPGVFQAYPGSRVRFMVQLPPKAKALYLQNNPDEELIQPRMNEEKQATHEFVLRDKTELRFFLSEDQGGGRTEPYVFQPKLDLAPEIQLRGHTPEGPFNTLDPLIIEAEVKDDFGVKRLQAVIRWEDQEKRIDISVPPDRKKHFLTRNQWYISDFDLPDVESFTICLEATDNNPIDGPGVGESPCLTYQLESPEKKYDEFMKLARELLNAMTHTLGDNLETSFAATIDSDNLQEAEVMGRQIGSGLFNSVNLTTRLINKVRETPSLTRLDQSFLQKFRNGVSNQARQRTEINLLYTTLQFRATPSEYNKLLLQHQGEEIGIENLTYDLLMQLKMWAVLDLERKKQEIENEMDSLEELMANSENLETEELMERFNKLMDEIMKDFQEMAARISQEMERNMSEFMNMDALKLQEDMLDDLRKQIMDALREGDMEKAKKLMEQFKAQMQENMASMQQAMGQMSPEMQAMMQDMRELMGLLRELKTGEEELERNTQNLKREIDQEMGGNPAEMSAAQQKEYRKATERIHELLENLYNQLVEYKTDGMIQEVVDRVTDLRGELEREDKDPAQASQLRREINRQERMLDFLSRDGLDRLQNITLNNLEQTEKLQEYLDQNEFMLSLESGLKLESSLVNGERMSEQTPSRKLSEEMQPTETFREAREELYKILDALQNLKHDLEDQRRQFMRAQSEQRQQSLANRQAELEKMIQQFMENTEDTFDGTQIAQKLKDIELSMRNAEQKLGDAKLEGGIQYEQAALQKIGEMLEQLQQSQRPSGQPRPQFMLGQKQRQGMMGDPLIEDIYIPESQKRATKDQMKEMVRRQLKKNLPDSYGKEIRKYYEKLIDQ